MMDIIGAKKMADFTNEPAHPVEHPVGKEKEKYINSYLKEIKEYMTDIIRDNPQHREECKRLKRKVTDLLDDDVDWIKRETDDIRAELEACTTLLGMDRIVRNFYLTVV